MARHLLKGAGGTVAALAFDALKRYSKKGTKQKARTYHSNTLAKRDKQREPTLSAEGHLKTFTEIRSTKDVPARCKEVTLRTRVTATIAGGVNTSTGRQAFSETGPMALNRTTILGLGNASGGFYLYSNELTTTFTNMSNFQIIVDIYDFVCKRPCELNISELFMNGSGSLPDGIGNPLYHTYIGVNPLAIPLVTDNWNCEGRHNVILNPGVVWVHKYKRTPKKLIAGRKYEGSLLFADQTDHIPGFTMNSWICVRGPPVYEGPPPQALTACGGQKLVYYQTESLKYQIIDNTDDREILLASSTFSTTGVNQTKILDETELVATMVNAA